MGQELTPVRKRQRRAFLSWCVMTDLERKQADAPETQVAYSEKYNIPVRTLRNWRASKDGEKIYQELLAERVALRAAMAAQELGEDSPLLHVPDPNDPEGDVQPDLNGQALDGPAALMNMAFSQLATLVAAGDVRSISTLLNTPVAKQYMESLTAEFSRTFEDVTDEQLMVEILSFVPTDVLERELARRDL